MLISTDTEKAFDKIQHPFMKKKKPLRKLGREGNFLNRVNDVYENPPANTVMVKD